MIIKPSDIFGKGYMTTEQIMCQGVPFNVIDEWLSSSLIERADRGVYCLPRTKKDELALIQYRYDRCIFSGITALSLHGLSDHISEHYHVSFPQGYNPSSLKDCQWDLSITRSVPKIYGLGKTTVRTELGNEICVYDRERSLCDILRGKGLPAVSGYGSGTGDMYVKILVWIPKKLSSSEKDAIQNMRASRTFTPDPSREDKAVFDKMKDIF